MKTASQWVLIFLTLASVHLAEAQRPVKSPRIGFLVAGSSASEAPRVKAFRDGLRQLGYVDGQNVSVEYRYGDGRPERFPALAADLVRLKVNVIVVGGTPIRAIKNATSTLPIVMAVSTDPVASGYVESLARPGGNITGLSSMARELSSKRLELFREAFPKVNRLGVLWYVTINTTGLGETQTAAQSLGFKIESLEIRSLEDFDSAFAVVTRKQLDGLFTLADAFLTAHRKRILGFAAENRLPAMYHNEDFVEDGGLMSYAPSVLDLYRRAAIYVDKILKGANPADLPVEQPTKFDLVINLKTAKQIGLTIPPNVLARADRVIK